MEGVTDFATRLWLAQTSAPDEATTPFLRVTKDYPPKRISANFLPESELSKEHGVVSCVPQLMASDTADFIRIAEYFLEKVPFVDLNCGCPSPTVVGHGAGSSLLQTPERLWAYLSAAVSALGAKKVSVKMRIGFLNESEFPELLSVVASFPLARLTIHGRTRQDRYSGKARWSPVHVASQHASFPVIGSGDVFDIESFDERMNQAPGAAGVIVGRGALRNPWLFRELRERQNKTVVTRKLLKARILLFVLLQELQANYWDPLFDSVRDGDFSCGSGMDGELAEDLNHRIAAKIFQNSTLERMLPVEWPISRTSLARGKLLWNYFRSGLSLAPELSVAILRSIDWQGFLQALDQSLLRLPDSEICVSYQKEWDWVYSGSGQKCDSDKVL